MENDFIPYEKALALKELGFNQACLGHYIELKNPQEGLLQIGLSDDFLQAPTFSQCFRWFREKYSFYVIIKPSINNDFTCVIWTSKAQYHIGFFLSYEEAELACLVYLIDIVRKYIPIEKFNV